MRKPDFCICENKDADQLRGNREADQHLCFRYIESTIPLLPKSEISSQSSHLLWLYRPVCVGPGRKPRRPLFSQRGSYVNGMQIMYDSSYCINQGNRFKNKFAHFIFGLKFIILTLHLGKFKKM